MLPVAQGPSALLQGIPEQQSLFEAHCWPSTPQAPASVAKQVPLALPGWRAQTEPRQHAPSSLQVAPGAPHAVCEQTYGGEAFATGFGTHGALLQQLALDAHEPPAATHWAPEQRGTPAVSG